MWQVYQWTCVILYSVTLLQCWRFQHVNLIVIWVWIQMWTHSCLFRYCCLDSQALVWLWAANIWLSAASFRLKQDVVSWTVWVTFCCSASMRSDTTHNTQSSTIHFTFSSLSFIVKLWCPLWSLVVTAGLYSLQFWWQWLEYQSSASVFRNMTKNKEIHKIWHRERNIRCVYDVTHYVEHSSPFHTEHYRHSVSLPILHRCTYTKSEAALP